MNNLIQNLNYINDNLESLKMYYLTRIKKKSSDNEYISYSVPIASSIKDDIKSLILDNLIDGLQNKEIVDFNPTLLEQGTIEKIPCDHVNNYNTILNTINSIQTESVKDLDFNHIWGYSIRLRFTINNATQDLFIFKKFAYPKLLKQSLILSLTSDEYTKITDEIITIDNQVHAFSLTNDIYILNKGQFETFFNFSSTYETIIQKSMASLKELDVIDNFDDFASRCLDSDTLTRRLVKIIEDERFKILQSCIQNVPQVIEDFALKVHFKNSKIIYDSESTVSDIITLIKGSCVYGALDNEKYLALDTKKCS